LMPFIAGQPVGHQRALLTAFVLGPERVMIVTTTACGLMTAPVSPAERSLDVFALPLASNWRESL